MGTETIVQPPAIAIYQGADGFIMGVSARDLTAGDWGELTDAQKRQAWDSGLYHFEPGVERPADLQGDTPEGA